MSLTPEGGSHPGGLAKATCARFRTAFCLDAEGAVWVASPLTNEAIRVREGGAVTDRVAADRHVIACMLGGVDRRTLFVLAATAIPRAEARAQRGARILATTVDVPGAGSP